MWGNLYVWDRVSENMSWITISLNYSNMFRYRPYTMGDINGMLSKTKPAIKDGTSSDRFFLALIYIYTFDIITLELVWPAFKVKRNRWPMITNDERIILIQRFLPWLCTFANVNTEVFTSFFNVLIHNISAFRQSIGFVPEVYLRVIYGTKEFQIQMQITCKCRYILHNRNQIYHTSHHCSSDLMRNP